jgi:hypothetical protein
MENRENREQTTISHSFCIMLTIDRQLRNRGLSPILF